ncbi:MAG: solute-binding protein [Phycisphaerales bacterium]|nr:solute-binding protein [Phycisphaerales bacterium]
MTRRKLGIVFIAVLTSAIGCKQESATQPAADTPRLLLFCGAGLQLPVAELVETFNREQSCIIEADYAGSEVLFSRITIRNQGDLYMPGEQSYLDLAVEKDMIESSAVVCYFVPVILVGKGNPKNIATLSDLTRPGVRLGLGDERACAIGQHCKRIFAKNDIPWADVEKNLAFKSMTVNELGIQIQTGALDAVIVWDAVAVQYLKHGEIVTIPPERNIVSSVPIGVLTFSEHKELARQFIAFARSPAGRDIFQKHNYRVDPPVENQP